MGKDVEWKSFFQDNHRYADIINGIGCGGVQLVKDTDLSEADPSAKKKSRDMLRKVALGVNFAIVGIENQDELDYELPLRNMYYDASQYQKQASAIRKEVKAEASGLKPGEYMYGFKKDSKLNPLVTFILYAGKETWDGPHHLYDMLDFTDIPETLKELDEDAFDVVTKYTNSKELVQVKDYSTGGKNNVCKAIQDLMADSREKGIEQGREEGKSIMIINMLKENVPLETICRIAECDEAFVEKVKSQM